MIFQNSTLILLLTILTVFIWQFGSYISESYAVVDYEQKIDGTSTENQKLGKDLQEAEKFDKIENIAQSFNFVKTQSIRYLKVLTGEVASK